MTHPQTTHTLQSDLPAVNGVLFVELAIFLSVRERKHQFVLIRLHGNIHLSILPATSVYYSVISTALLSKLVSILLFTSRISRILRTLSSIVVVLATGKVKLIMSTHTHTQH